MALDLTYDPNWKPDSKSGDVDLTYDPNWKPQGILGGLGSSLKRGIDSTVDYGKISLTDNPDEIAGIVSENIRNRPQPSAAQQKMNAEIAPYAKEASDAQGIVGNIGAYAKLYGKRAMQLAENPREFAGMVAENLPNSAPGIAGMVAGGAAGAATPVPFGAAIGGVVGGTAGGYKIEQGSSMFDQVVKEAQARGIDTNNKPAMSAMIAEKYPEFLKASQLKGVGTAGTDAVLNVATLGVAGIGERALAREARSVADLAKAGKMTGEEAASAIAGIEAKNAARNTIGQKALRGAGVAAGEMAGESLSEAAGQQLAYGKLDPLDVVDEGLLAFGQGVGMAAGRKFISPLVGATDKDSVTQEIERARAFATALNQSVGGDVNAVPTLITDLGPLQQRIDDLHGIGNARMNDAERAKYEQEFNAAFGEVVGYTTDKDGMEIPFTMGDYLNSQVRSADITRDRPKAANAVQQSESRLQQVADEETTGYVAPEIPVVGTLSAVANMAIKSGANAQNQMQQAMQAALAKQGKPEKANGPIAAATDAQVATQGAQGAGGNVPGSAGVSPSALAGNQERAGNGAEVAAPGLRPAVSAGIAGVPAGQLTPEVSRAAQPAQVAAQAAQANAPQVGAQPAAAPAAGQAIDLSGSTEQQLLWLTLHGKNGHKEAAVAELQRRGTRSPAQPERSSAKTPRKPVEQWSSDEIQARLDRGNMTADSENKLRDLLATKKPARPAPEKPAGQIAVGHAPGDAQPVTVRNGVIHIGDDPAIDYETEQDVTVPDGATPQQIADALKSSGALGRRKVFGVTPLPQMAKKAADQEPVKNEAPAAAMVSKETKAPEQESIKKTAGKPRMGESADELIAALKKAAEGVTHEGKILYPTIFVPGMGGSFRMNADGSIEKIVSGGFGITKASEEEINDVQDSITKDQVQVVLRSHWGGSGSTGTTKVVKELHSPTGNSFKKDAAVDVGKEPKSFGNPKSSSKVFLSVRNDGGFDAVYIRDKKESRGEAIDVEQARYSHIDTFSKAVDFLISTRPHLRGSYFEDRSERIDSAVDAESQPKTDTTPEARQDKAQAITPQHVENGKAESATAAVVEQSLKKGAANSPLDLRQERDLLLKKIDAAIAAAPTAEEKSAWDRVNQKIDLTNNMHVADTIGYRVFEVPGDGKFKVLNLKEALQRFRERVEANPGFNKPANTTGLQKVAPWQRTTQGGTEATVKELLDQGEYSAANEYAKQIGKPLIFGQYQDGSAITVYTEAKPFEREGYDDFNMVSVRAVGAADKVAWAVVDLNSGLTVSSKHPTRLKAIAETNKALEKTTPEQMAVAVRSVKANTPGIVGTQEELEQRWLANVEQREAEAQGKADQEHRRTLRSAAKGMLAETSAGKEAAKQEDKALADDISNGVKGANDPARQAAVVSEIEKKAGVYPGAKAKPFPLDFTPKQYHEARLKWMAERNGVPLAEVRENYDTDAGRKESDGEWVGAVRQAFKDGAELSRATLDKLEEVRTGAVQSFMHDYPEAKVPSGYQTPGARKEEQRKADERREDRAAIKNPAAPKESPAELSKPAEDGKPANKAEDAKPTPAVDAEKPAESKSPAAIGDFGEKIGGAKKDLWTGYKDKLAGAEALDIKAEPLSKSWPAPDYEALIESGVDSFVVAFIRASRDSIPRKPTATWKLKSWAGGVELLRDTSKKLIDGELSSAQAKELLQKAGDVSRGMRDIAGRIELYQLVGHRQSLDGISLSNHFYSLYKGKENVNLWAVEKEAKATAFSNMPAEIVTGSTKQEVLDKFKALYDKVDFNKKADRAVTFDLYSQGGKFYVGKKMGRNITQLAGPFGTIKETRAYRDEHHDELVARLEKAKEIPKPRRDKNEPRVGEDMRDGQDVTPEMFAESFGFKGVEFGNWVEQKKRQKDLNESFDALMDMAAILNIPPKALSLNGQLGLAFGARGAGGIDPAAAHYERDFVVINLTKKEGAGSLGHEWFHALDNYFSRLRGKGSDMMTEALDVSLAGRGSDFIANTAVRKEMIQAFGRVVNSIKMTALRERSAKLDNKRSKAYWTTTPEMAARAFESYLISKLQDQNASNDYLANIVDPQTWKAAESLGFELDDSYPYPTAGEIPLIREAFDKFFQAVETKQTDKGIAIFSQQYGKAIPESEWLSVGAIAEEIQNLLQPFSTEIPVLVRDTLGDIGVEGTDDGVTSGAVYQGRIHLFRDGLADRSAVVRTLWHEMLHFGLRRFMDERQYIAKMNELYQADGWIRNKADAWAKSDEAKGVGKGKPLGYVRARAVDEALAELAETLQTQPTGFNNNTFLAKAKRAVSEWVAKLADALGFTEAAQAWRSYAAQKDARDLVVSTFAKLREGAPPSMLTSKWHYSDPAFMTAWHGSPHDHNKFDSSKIGTGEGAQAYGHGLYFASSKGVAEWYRKNLSGSKDWGIIKQNQADKAIKEFVWPVIQKSEIYGVRRFETIALEALQNQDTLESHYDRLNERFKKARGEKERAFSKRDIDLIDEIGSDAYSSVNAALESLGWKGRLYQVELAPSADEYLDWDKPLGEQSNKVKASLLEWAKVAQKESFAELEKRDRQFPGSVKGIEFIRPDVYSAQEYLDEYANLTGGDFYAKTKNDLADRAAEGTSKAYYKDERWAKEASDYLHSIGIRGIRYLDGSSRSAGEGNSNYVIFNDADVSVTAKYNVASGGKISPADKSIYGMAAEGKSAAEILKFIASASRSPFYRQLAKLLLKTGIAPQVMASTTEGWRFNAGNDKKYAAAYNESTNTIALFRPAAAERNFLHEAMHAATIRALGRKGLASGQMKALFEHVKKNGNLKGMYGMSDIDEFVAEAFSNPKFQDALKKIAAPKASSSTLSSAWNWFVRIVRGILGIPQGQENALSQAIEIGLGVMREDMKLRKNEASDGISPAAHGATDPKFVRYSQSGVQYRDGISDESSGNRVIDGAELQALRRAAARIERPEAGVTLYITHDGRAITSGPNGARIPDRYRRFAEENNLTFEARRLPSGSGVFSPAMPVSYRENGAKYFGDLLANEKPIDRTDKTRYNIADEGWSVSEPSKMDDVIYALQDKQIDMKRVVQSIMRTGKKVKDEVNAYLQEELFHGRAAKGVKDFLDFELRPLLKQMQDAKVDMGDFEEYLWNRHAEERNKQIAKINPDMPDGGSGIETAKARAYLAGLSAEQRKTFEALAAKVEAMNRESQRVLVESGLEKQSTIDAWNGAYQHYVPLQRDDVDSGHVGTGKGFSVRGSSSKRAMGSGKKVVDIIANLTMQRERNIVRAEKNRVSNALLGLAVQNPNPDFWKVDQAPKERVVQEKAIYTVLDSAGNKIEEFTRMDDAERLANKTPGAIIDQAWGDRVTERVMPGFTSRDNVLLTRINGEDHYVIFNERDERAMRMATAMKNLDMDNLGRVLSVVGKATRYLASINTQYNPVFGVINLIRDAQGALINLSSTPLAGEQKRVLGYTKDALVGIYKDIRAHRAGGKPSSNWAALFEEFQKEGGQTGYRDQYANAEARAESIKSELEQFKDGKAKQLARGLFGWLSDYNETMENAVRLAAYKAAKEKGMSNQQAASLAKNITVNFNRKGQMATQVGALYAFFNASVQGTARIAETLFDQHGGDIKNVRLSKKGKQILAGGIMLGAMQALLLAAAGFDDDEPPEFIRERNLILPIGGGKYLTLAMPLGLHVIPGIGRIATEFVLSGGKDPLKRIAAFGSMFADAFNPIGSAGWSLQTITPSVVDPFAALAENKDFTGKEIYREDFNKLNPTPGHARAKDVATFYSRAISEALNFITGGSEFKPGLVSWSPDSIDYLIGQVTGGVGREANKALQTAGSAYSGEDLPLYKIPLVGRFVGDTAGQSGQSQKFYDAIKQINMHEAQYKGLIKDGRSAEAREYLAENPAVRLIMAGNHAELAVRKLRTMKRDLVENDADQDKIRAIDARITETMRRFNERAGAFI